ncbi:GumC domain-containing protein [Anditalea andensis]|uniref:Exopolysaccharide biosynthesis protein n=1 Tax=Anditalea andensis TaxID=1048983 RepID=A0A074KZL9_9BACT|nr:exopolysaccharide biosynthesis protein [Anditalea andensis]KEO73625.1 exopolysaccharide biosynthesis protein [Anditalea andensis]
MTDYQHIKDDKITFRELILRLQGWSEVFKRKWKILVVFLIIGLIAGAAVSVFKKPIYIAETTFVLEESDMGGMGGSMSGLASLVGINLGSLGSSNGLFSGDNIMELYRSDNMLSKTLLSPMNAVGDSGQLLINRYITFNKLDRKWRNEVDFSAMDFAKNREMFSIKEDSVVKEIIKEIRKSNLSVSKPDRKLSIIQVSIASKDQLFAKYFNEQLVENVNTFYYETKTKKTAENLSILQTQADSVRKILDRSLTDFASATDNVPNPNPLVQRAMVESRKRQVDVQASSTVYSEIVKNLEIAKVNHRNNSPLIQIIDFPRFPLEESKIKLLKGLIIGGLSFFILGIFYIYLSTLYAANIRESA